MPNDPTALPDPASLSGTPKAVGRTRRLSALGFVVTTLAAGGIGIQLATDQQAREQGETAAASPVAPTAAAGESTASSASATEAGATATSSRTGTARANTRVATPSTTPTATATTAKTTTTTTRQSTTSGTTQQGFTPVRGVAAGAGTGRTTTKAS